VFTNEHGSTTTTVATLTVDAQPPPPPFPPSISTPPHISGAALVAATLAVSTGVWTGSPDAYDYAWFDCPDAAGRCVQVGIDAATYAPTSSDRNGTVYAEVRAHNSGGWSDFVRSDDAIIPLVGGPGHGGQGKASVGRIRVAGASAYVALACGSVAAACRVKLTLSVTETMKGSHLIAVSARKRPGLVKKVVVLGSTIATLDAGRSKTVKVALRGAGRRLLARERHMHVKLGIAQSGSPGVSAVLTFKAKR
jgi:hypothetical protein